MDGTEITVAEPLEEPKRRGSGNDMRNSAFYNRPPREREIVDRFSNSVTEHMLVKTL